jgi:hypothetical protein
MHAARSEEGPLMLFLANSIKMNQPWNVIPVPVVSHIMKYIKILEFQERLLVLKRKRVSTILLM